MLLYARLKGLLGVGAGAESSWTEFAQRKEDSWERNDWWGADMVRWDDQDCWDGRGTLEVNKGRAVTQDREVRPDEDRD